MNQAFFLSNQTNCSPLQNEAVVIRYEQIERTGSLAGSFFTHSLLQPALFRTALYLSISVLVLITWPASKNTFVLYKIFT